MSDLSAAAQAMGLPESLVERSAEARAAETGSSVDEIIAAWAGGEAAVSSPASEASVGGGGAEGDGGGTTQTAPAEEAEDETEAAPAEEEETPAQEEAAPPPPTPVIDSPEPAGEPTSAPAAAAGPYKPPVLVGAKDQPMTVLAGVLGLFFLVLMVGLVGPSIPEDPPGARTSEIDYSEAALHGQEIYANTGCAACHTQMVRPVVADVGLGPVTLNDTNQILGTRRFGPDLSDVGSRITASQLEAIIGGLGDHPALSLGDEDLSSLVTYLSESATSQPSEDAVEEDPAEETEES